MGESEIADVDSDGSLEIFHATGTLPGARTRRVIVRRLPCFEDSQLVRLDRSRTDVPGLRRTASVWNVNDEVWFALR